MQKKLVALAAAPLSLAISLALAPGQAFADEKSGGYVSGPNDSVWKNAYGECWESAGGDPTPREECGDMVAMPAEDGDEDGDGVPDSRDRCPGTRPGAKVDMFGCEITESMTIDLTADEFAFDSAELTAPMKDALDGVASQINASPGDELLGVVGHTDSVGPAEYNQGLSERRAQSVADYLESKGINADRMNVFGRGEEEPVADNATREGRAKNRRVDIKTR